MSQSKKIISVIRQQLKKSFDRIGNERFKKNLLQAIPFWIASMIAGLAAVAYAKLFIMAEEVALWVFNYNIWLLFALTPVCFVLAWLLVWKFAPYAKGSGIPQVMAGIAISAPKTGGIVAKLLSLKVMVVKVLSSLIMAMGGGAIGREGPTIQISASIFRSVNSMLPHWWPKVAKRNMIVTGAAAGLAAAFNTPLGGIVFAIEELTKTHFSFFKTAIFSSVIIAGLTAQAILGPYLYLGYPKVDNTSNYIFFGVLIVALISGLLGSLMGKLILVVLRWKARLKSVRANMVYVVCCAIILVTLAILFGANALGSGKQVMETVLFTSDRHAHWYVPIIRICSSMVSFTTGAAGGIFAPALAAGASVGSVIAGWFNLSETNTNLLILAGMVGFLTGVTRSPFTSAILVLEMTNRQTAIFSLILAGMVASLVSMLIDKHSLYDHLKIQYIKELEEVDREEKKDLVLK
ncbi:chloride channel protein [Pedobacter sp. LMG 31464]|uniref:Chloride channel protein n=1 Tax=Pedobacter planticolens TaxID=2679964 RepID=A0A923E3J5_9SPHI|nr:chloride channel protein [Pedobacter planticolens]MBB2146859.1 chloride channel protein [Pedobacter planticolens]